MNRFRDRAMRAAYARALTAYAERHPNLFLASGRRNTGNAPASWFWRGYDHAFPGRWDPGSRQMLAYAWWRAGQDVHNRERRPIAKPTESCSHGPVNRDRKQETRS